MAGEEEYFSNYAVSHYVPCIAFDSGEIYEDFVVCWTFHLFALQHSFAAMSSLEFIKKAPDKNVM